MIGCGFLLQGYAHGVEGLLAGGQGMLIGVATLYGLFWIRVLGAGDVKLFCAIGAFMGKEVWNVLLYTCIFSDLLELRRFCCRSQWGRGRPS